MATVTKLIPLYVIILVAITLGVEYYCNCNIDLESYVPMLTALGLGGIPLKVVRDAIAARKAIDTEKFKNALKTDN